MARREGQTGPTIFDTAAPADGAGTTEAAPAPTPGPDDAAPAGSARPPRLTVCADGGARGNPGPAAYGALVRDASTGEVLDQEGLTLGSTTNNVAEYSGLIAGLEMARAINPDAAVDVRMDSKLVIEQMAGRWKIKNPAMKDLAARAQRVRPARVTWTWVPRAENKAADALVNKALDGSPTVRRG
ncbi:reverse transcriptase-like protein [Propionicicella superfundia]|uniref:reverse transcriptase-like protein n=1 Tax=Propionicicella superfundia TaxID=348582 RepID=UPI000490F4B5|nr:reverse transcriptase-like protein [Propionicicella superfundia]